ncbi:MAG: nucleoside/nucleotide kinase family protein [Acidimicrobiales bacterium]
MQPELSDLVARCRALVARGGRVLGIAGVPGAGKSTLAARLVEAWGPTAQLLPMDGFHCADDELARLGRGHRKGAPDTFDVDGYVSALVRVHERTADVLVPRFDRMLEAAIAGSIRIATSSELVVTEGNYLLLDDQPWRAVRPLLDEAWMVEADPAERIEQLVERHVHHGRDRAAAEAWVRDVDEPNARLIGERSTGADLVVRR